MPFGSHMPHVVHLNQLAQVLVAGTPKQVEAAVAEAEPLREQLEERSVFVVPLPVFRAEGQGEPPALEETDLKCAAPHTSTYEV